jgi:hypothetical protein
MAIRLFAADPSGVIGSFDVADARGPRGSSSVLTKEILFGMNILTLVGLLLTGFGLTLRRMGRAGLPLCIGVMSVGTVLVLAGLYASGWWH